MNTPLTIAALVHDRLAHLTLSGNLNLDSQRLLRDAVRDHLAAVPALGIVVNASAVSSIDAHGLGLLLACRRKVLAAGSTFRVVDASVEVRRFCAPNVMLLLAGIATFAEIADLLP